MNSMHFVISKLLLRNYPVVEVTEKVVAEVPYIENLVYEYFDYATRYVIEITKAC